MLTAFRVCRPETYRTKLTLQYTVQAMAKQLQTFPPDTIPAEKLTKLESAIKTFDFVITTGISRAPMRERTRSTMLSFRQRAYPKTTLCVHKSNAALLPRAKRTSRATFAQQTSSMPFLSAPNVGLTMSTLSFVRAAILKVTLYIFMDLQ